jgi:ubiquitin-conjugating enzyme E2 Q
MVEIGGASEGETLSDLEFLFSDDETHSASEGNKSKGKAIAV